MTASAGRADTILETDNITKHFEGLTAVDEVSIEAPRGEIYAVIGPNGAGKSTLFNLISGLLKPSGGQVYFNGEDITNLPPNEIVHRGITRSFQIVDLFDGLTVEENIKVGTQSLDDRKASPWRRAEDLTESNDAARGVLEDVGLIEQADTRANSLSHGDRRKLEIGLAISVEPELLLLDEPTAGMGKDESIEIVRMIQRVAEERDITPMLIEHDLEIVLGVSDLISVLHEGRVLATGSPSEIQDDRAVRNAYLGARGS